MTEATGARPGSRPAEPRRPVHLAVAVGLSAGAYAAALAGVTALQASSDQALVSAQAPTVDAIERLRTGHERLAARLNSAGDRFNAAAAAYTDLFDGVDGFEQQLSTLAAQVKKVEGSAVALPGSVRMPAVGSASRSTATATHATTGASGG